MGLVFKDKVLIICVCGLSGSGKDTFAEALIERHKQTTPEVKRNMAVVTSYTTRGMRQGETNLKEHIFLKEMPKYKEGDVFAHVKYGGYDYWTTTMQMRQHLRNIYVVDEKTVEDLIRRSKLSHEQMHDYKSNPEGDHTHHWEFDVVTILVTADGMTRRSRGVSEERMMRDAERDMTRVKWDYIVNNDGDYPTLLQEVAKIHESIMKKKI